MPNNNILDAIMNIVESESFNIDSIDNPYNMNNSVGCALEDYVKDAFAGILGDFNIVERGERHSEIFSYFGSFNNLPKMIIKGGDAIEVKRIESEDSDIDLDASYPKNKLYSNSQALDKACKDCENWEEKDIIYVTGYVEGSTLSSISFVYGENYAASSESYERAKALIAERINAIAEVTPVKTGELGVVDRVDPLGITYMRINGSWHIANPMKVLRGIYQKNEEADFNLMALISKTKYNSFPDDDIKLFEDFVGANEGLSIEDVKMHNPDNPARLIDVKLIKYYV